MAVLALNTSGNTSAAQGVVLRPEQQSVMSAGWRVMRGGAVGVPKVRVSEVGVLRELGSGEPRQEIRSAQRRRAVRPLICKVCLENTERHPCVQLVFPFYTFVMFLDGLRSGPGDPCYIRDLLGLELSPYSYRYLGMEHGGKSEIHQLSAEGVD